jgi:uncharacterized membrane protein
LLTDYGIRDDFIRKLGIRKVDPGGETTSVGFVVGFSAVPIS